MKIKLLTAVLLCLASAPAICTDRLAWAAACERMDMYAPHPFGDLAKKYQKINLIINPKPTKDTVVISASMDNPAPESLDTLKRQLIPLVRSTGCAAYISERKGTAENYTIHTWRLFAS
ncbi:MAG: hypothetical protein JSR50_03120 [Proteobacteria bacterium]|nr:hypothetical protein [Pseudomonadota bacterium]